MSFALQQQISLFSR